MPADLQKVQAVIFDLDDTLVDWRNAEAKAIAALAQGFAAQGTDAAAVQAAYAQIMAENVASFHASRSWMYVGDRIALLMGRMRLQGDPAAVTQEFVTMARASLTLLEGAMDAIHAAKRTGRKVALLTNGPSIVQRPKIQAFALHEHLDYVGVTGEMGHWKPDAAAFLHVADHLGMHATQTLMVGDSLEFDIQPAKRLGMRTAWIDARLRADPSADFVLPYPGALVPHLLASAPA